MVRGYLLRLLRDKDVRFARVWRIAAPVLDGPLADRGRIAAPEQSAAASAAPAAARGGSLLMQTIEGRVTLADAMVNQINAASTATATSPLPSAEPQSLRSYAEATRSKRAADSVSPQASPPSAGQRQHPPHPRSRQRGPAPAPNALFAEG